ncbi:hypothetical protein [Pantoea sp. UBA6567]|uniref:hypothetical protein n=1 Tax=Pantoea sp. UBA6567 TaxID=1947043 RepID=UPI002598AC61|nr:hypothetical protein [Pantoea sp. UBA6567]
MSDSEATKLQEETKATEQAVSGVVEIANLPPLGALPEPPPAVQGPPKQGDDCSASEPLETSDEDELQNTWLSNIDSRLKLIEANASAAIKHAEADGKQTDNSLRRDMADKTFGFMEKWCAFVALIIFIYVAKHEGDPPTEVILALLGTCTVSIIGLVGFVVSGLFKTPKSDSK